MTNRMAAMPFYSGLAPDDVFWLCEFMRDTAALEALIELYEKLDATAPALQFAMFVAVKKARDEANRSLQHACHDGDLLFAHAQTTRLTRATGAAA